MGASSPLPNTSPSMSLISSKSASQNRSKQSLRAMLLLMNSTSTHKSSCLVLPGAELVRRGSRMGSWTGQSRHYIQEVGSTSSTCLRHSEAKIGSIHISALDATVSGIWATDSRPKRWVILIRHGTWMMNLE